MTTSTRCRARLRTFEIFSRNGDRFEFLTTFRATSARAARKRFLKIWDGRWTAATRLRIRGFR